ncbi:MAG: transporter [Pseudomonadota bacterium]
MKIHFRSTVRQFSLVMFSLLNMLPAYAKEESIVTDRPDFVESSDSVGKKHFQIETSVAYSVNHEKTISTWATPTLLRYGIYEDLEMRFETDGYLLNKTDGMSNQSGMSDAAVGVKWHIADQADKSPALALLFDVALPTGAKVFRTVGMRPSVRGVVEWELPSEIGLGIMPGVAYEKDENEQRHLEGIFGVTLSKGWTEIFRTYIEMSLPKIAKSQYGGTQAYFDTGAALLISRTLQLDIGLSAGLNNRSDRYIVGCGISKKF